MATDDVIAEARRLLDEGCCCVSHGQYAHVVPMDCRIDVPPQLLAELLAATGAAEARVTALDFALQAQLTAVRASLTVALARFRARPVEDTPFSYSAKPVNDLIDAIDAALPPTPEAT